MTVVEPGLLVGFVGLMGLTRLAELVWLTGSAGLVGPTWLLLEIDIVGNVEVLVDK